MQPAPGESQPAGLKIVHDQYRCASLGICEELAPELFEVSAEGVLVVLIDQPDATQLNAARRAAAGCPTGAISLVTEFSGEGVK